MPPCYKQVPGVTACSSSFVQNSCNLVNAYRGLIAPLLTDLNPGAGSAQGEGNVVIRSSSSQFCVAWRKAQLYFPDPVVSGEEDLGVLKYTFTTCLQPNGAIAWQYDAIRAPKETTSMVPARVCVSPQ